MILLQIYYTKEGVKMKNKQINRTLSLLLSVVMVLSLCPLISKAEGTKPNIKIGDYIKLGTYENEPILWRCVDIDDNGPLMLMDKVLGSMPYDAKTSENSATRSHSRNSFRSSYGSNHWRDSNMRSWLNSDADAGKVDWLCGNPPKSDYVGYGSEYDKKAGFLNGFSKAEIAAIKTVTQRSIVSHPEYSAGYIAGPGADLPYNTDIASVAYGFEKAYYENIIDKVFLPDVKQLNTIYNNSNILGNYYLAKNKDGIRWSYWLRTPITDCNHDMRYVETDGNIYRVAPYFGHIGVRPAFYLDTDYYIVSEGNGEVNSPYVGDAADKPGDDISISGPDEEGGDGDWDIDTDQSIQLNLGPWYSSDGEYANSTIPVQVIQKTRSDLENMVIVICGEGYTKDQQQKFINDVKRIWAGVLKHEPYRSMADRFNVYALCTASKTSGFASENTFFDITMSTTSRSPMISLYKSVLKNQILTRCIGPAFIEKIHDAHIKEKTNPNEITIGDEYAPYYYVNEYISQFVVLVNSGQYGGASMNNLDVGLHYVTATVDNIQSEYTLAHELGHGLLHLGDEYNAYGGAYTMPEQQDKQSLNIAGLRESPITIKWKDMLGFRKTYTCRDSNTSNSSNMVNSSWQCMMRTQNQELCDVCQLQGFKVMSQLIKDTDDIYIAIPEVKLYTGNYKNPFEDYSAYTEAEYYGYLAYASDRAQRLLSGTSKNKFTKDMKGQEVELRTIAQNLSGIEEQEITLQLWVEHEDGTRAVTENGEEILKEQTFTVPVWDEKENFYIKGMRNYSGTEFDSGLMNCSLIYKIPENADLKDGDTIKFSVIDKMGKTLADDNTETQNYANVTISYQLEDSNAVPNTQTAVIPVPIGTKMDIEPPEEMYGYKFVKAEGLGKIVGDDGLNIICYYEDPSGKLPVEYKVEYDWGTDFPTDTTLPTDNTKYDSIENAKEAVKNQKYDENSTSTVKKNDKDGTWTFSGWTATVEGTTVKFTGVWTFTENAIPVVTRKPSSGGSGNSGSSTYNIKVSPEITNGSLSVNPSRASNGKKVSVIVKPNNGYVLNSVIVKDSNDKEFAVTKQSDGTYTFIMPSSNVTVSAKFDTELAKDVVTEIEKSIKFKDVKKGDWYFDAVQWAVKNNITEGSGKDTFSPDVICTRTQMVTFLWRVAGSPEPKITKCDFRDVDNSAYYYKAVLWAVEKGVTVGTSDTTFSPNENVTRGQTVAFLYREAESPFETGEDVFNDVNSNDYYFKAVSWATKNGITVGTGNGKFEPDMDCNRAQIVAMLYRTQR